MRLQATLTSITIAALVSGCGATPSSPARSPDTLASKQTPSSATPPVDEGVTEAGLASYYADSLAGRPTASGEPYDPGALTAAHRTLPFGTMVEVSRDDGTTVTVRINDRGPFGKKKRIIDLSRRAAEKLGMIRAGVVTVRVRVLGRAGPAAR